MNEGVFVTWTLCSVNVILAVYAYSTSASNASRSTPLTSIMCRWGSGRPNLSKKYLLAEARTIRCAGITTLPITSRASHNKLCLRKRSEILYYVINLIILCSIRITFTELKLLCMYLPPHLVQCYKAVCRVVWLCIGCRNYWARYFPIRQNTWGTYTQCCGKPIDTERFVKNIHENYCRYIWKLDPFF